MHASTTMRTNDALLLFLLLLLATAAAGRGLGGNDKPPGEVTVSTDSFIPGPGGRFYGGGNDFPGFRGGGGWGGGYGGPSSGYARSGVVAPPSVVCAEMGPCYKKKLTCPASCFTSYSYSGKGYGGGGGGGGCTMDCKKQCVAYC